MGNGKSPASKIRGVRLTFADGSKMGYRVNDKGVITDLTGSEVVNGIPSISAVIKNAKARGIKFETFDKKSLSEFDKQHAQDRLDLKNGLKFGKDNQVMREASRKWRVKMNRSGALFS